MGIEILTLASKQSTYYFLLKRVFDVVFSLSILIALSPLYLFISIAIRLSSPGKAIYTQERLGKNGKIFKCLKFRTMSCEADSLLEFLLHQDPQLQKEWKINQKLKEDPRIFSFGKFLRKTSLDELPQFWNVVKGDLSVVGPRPYMVNQRSDLGAFTFKILSVRPGITGLWQTSGRSKTTFEQRILLDAKYVDHKSFLFDLYLILKTLPLVIFPKDAY